jgi:hypothetical protein
MCGFDSCYPSHLARSSSGSGRRPLKAEITSSNLVRATTNVKAVGFAGGLFCYAQASDSAGLWAKLHVLSRPRCQGGRRCPEVGVVPGMRRALRDDAREGWRKWVDMRSIFNAAGGNGQKCGLQSRRIERTAPVVRNAVSKTPGQGVAREARSKNASHRGPQNVRFKPMGGEADRISRDLSHCRELVGDRGRAEPSGDGASAGEEHRRLRRQHPRALCGAGARAVRGRAIGSPSQMHRHRSSPPRFMASSAGQLASRRSWASGGGAPWRAGTTCMPAARGATVRLRLGALVV